MGNMTVGGPSLSQQITQSSNAQISRDDFIGNRQLVAQRIETQIRPNVSSGSTLGAVISKLNSAAGNQEALQGLKKQLNDKPDFWSFGERWRRWSWDGKPNEYVRHMATVTKHIDDLLQQPKAPPVQASASTTKKSSIPKNTPAASSAVTPRGIAGGNPSVIITPAPTEWRPNQS